MKRPRDGQDHLRWPSTGSLYTTTPRLPSEHAPTSRTVFLRPNHAPPSRARSSSSDSVCPTTTCSLRISNTHRYFYIVFPLFWAFGGALIWRRTDFANTDLSPNTKNNTSTSTFEKTKTTRKERRHGVIGHKSNATLKTTTTVSVHLPYADDRWAWACL